MVIGIRFLQWSCAMVVGTKFLHRCCAHGCWNQVSVVVWECWGTSPACLKSHSEQVLRNLRIIPIHTFLNSMFGGIFAIFLHTLSWNRRSAGISQSSYTHFSEFDVWRDFRNLPSHTYLKSTHFSEINGWRDFHNLPTHTFLNSMFGGIFANFLHTLFWNWWLAWFSQSSYTRFTEIPPTIDFRKVCVGRLRKYRQTTISDKYV